MADSVLPSIFSALNMLQEKFSFAASSSCPFDVPKLKKLNEMVYEIYNPGEGRSELEIVFFHGLQLRNTKDAHVTTWMARDNSHLWIQTWLVELFPKARILSVSYDSSAEQTEECGMLDMYCTAENLLWSLLADEVRVGQAGSPVVFVGHCLGGLVLKELCLSAAAMMGRKRRKMPGMERVKDLLSNVRGAFFYGTPHIGSLLGDKLHNYFTGALLEEMETLKVSSARRNQNFDDLRSKYGWITSGMGELRKTYVESLGTYIYLVTEASSRQSMDTYYSASTDHYNICKAEGKESRALQQLGNFLHTILEDRMLQAGVVADTTCNQEYFIDTEGRTNQVCSWLARTDTHTIFIVGLSGVGKTALARQVVHDICHNFDATCFVSLDSIEGQSNGTDQVWRKIQEALEGIRMGSIHNLPGLLYQLKSKRVLMVLDNVESQGQLDVLRTGAWLEGSSSKLIVTSTTARLGTPANTFELKGLNPKESQQLFRHYAFQGREGPDGLRDLIQQVIEKCDNYPLFLKILAGFVSKDAEIHAKELWLELLDRLAKAEDLDGSPDYRLWAKWKVCYNVLLPSEKEIFLDCATIFHGFPLLMVKKYIWRVSREVPHVAWLNLKSRFLVTVNNGLIQMHAQLRNLGHNIACPRSAIVEKWKRISRYTLTKEIRRKLVSKDKGPMESLALELYIMDNYIFKPKNAMFHSYEYLQYLVLEGGRSSSVTVGGKLKLPRSLVYLRWKHGLFTVCPVDFTSLKKLAVLELLGCSLMISLPHSILKATKLTWLELRGCSALTELPSGLSKCLEYLGLNGTCLRELPDDFGNFKKLVDVEVQHTKITRVPPKLGGLEMLSSLDLSNTMVTILPDSIGNLKHLRYLNVERTGLTSLPDSIGRLQELKELHLAHTKLGSLPESIGGLQELWHLRLHGTCLKSLPQSIGDLVKLQRLILEFTPLEALPDTIGKLCNLLSLGLVGTQLSTLPETMGELAVLEELNLPFTSLQSVPQTLRKLSRLSLLMIDLGALVQAVESTEARQQGEEERASATRDWLSESTIHYSVLHDLPFHTVGYLSLSGRGYPQSWIQLLFQRFKNMPSLWFLRLDDFNLVETIPCELGMLTSLTHLELNGWERLQELPESLGKLCQLEDLRLRNNPSLCRLPESLGQLSNLAFLWLENNKSLRRFPESLGQLFNLGNLWLENNASLCRLPESVSALASLVRLWVRNCGSLQSIRVSALAQEFSTSEGEEDCTQSNSVQAMALPQLELMDVDSDSWSLVEYFLEGWGEHFATVITYYAECEQMEKAIRIAMKSRTDYENREYYVLPTKMAMALFGGQHFSEVDCCRRTAFRPAASRHDRFQYCSILCKIDNCKIHRCQIKLKAQLDIDD